MENPELINLSTIPVKDKERLIYYYLKKTGYCTKCRKEKAEPNRTQCRTCLDNYNNRSKEYYKNKVKNKVPVPKWTGPIDDDPGLIWGKKVRKTNSSRTGIGSIRKKLK